MKPTAFISAFTRVLPAAPHLARAAPLTAARPLLQRRAPAPSRVTHACARHAPPDESSAARADDSRASRVDEDEVALEEALHGLMVSLAGAAAALGAVAPVLAVPDALVEAFKSKPASLAHPGLMWVLLGTCLYTFYLGYQSSLLRKAEPAERKQLIKGRFGERHFRTSSLLFATMTCATFTGMANTYTRTGKLFPGPHLYAGLGLVATMSVMAAFVPYMQKGKDWARNAHFSIAFAAVGLFGWQAKSGMAIVGKLLGWK